MDNQELINLIDELRALPKETEWVEFKLNTIKPNEKLGEYISGLSNAACVNNQSFAYLILGVDDNDHSIKGTTYNFKQQKQGNEDLEFWIRRYLSPSIRFEYFECQYGGHTKIEIFRILATIGEPTNFQNKAFIRLATSLTQLKDYPHYAKIIYNSQEDWSAKIIDKATIVALDESAIQKAKEKYKEKRVGKPFYSEIDNWSNALFLDRAKITIDGKITNTAIILLGKPESAHFISPSVAQITWKLDTDQKAYEHFGMPLFLTINDVLKQIRIVRHKFFPNNQLIATEVLNYDTEVILEGLNNCIAHQDYSYNSRIILTEKANKLVFENAGSFFEGKADDYLLGEKTPKNYRNKFLVEAMLNLNMIDSLGYGIFKMTKSQYHRYFPLPDYTKSKREEVVLEIYGNSIDENFSKLLIEYFNEINLSEVILLDKVQKTLPIKDEAAKLLKKKGFIEGRKPNYFISAQIAELTNQKAAYTRNMGLDKEVLMSFIVKHIENHGFATREEIDLLLLDKLLDYIDDKQRKKKIENILQEMKKDKIKNIGSRGFPKWVILGSD
ncbi:RNA-binding domain-containing protein [Arachidicoccus soli]|uniref:Transcriptional regulator n=1 Tax=Arachidicoccus soli TaxID=2341117 RepID=A0A386HLJ5_9BACT|nr:RNA-binding domain-containing protein [Arachidicoccus soli]AYD46390.1 transcriptional regulator [Arachidicoccus soli]